MNRNVDKFCDGLDNLGITFNDEDIDKFLKYYNILIEKNKVMNLTRITDFEEVVVKHFLDSLSIIKVINPDNIERVIDIGTGAGFPGLPLKIIFPHLKMTLLDSLNKRISFLNEVIDTLVIDNIDAIHGRAEDYGRNDIYREKYDLSVSRAVSNLSSLSEYCLPFVKVGGMFISYKSADSDEEIDNADGAIRKLSGKVDVIKKFNLPSSDVSRCLVCIKKVKKMSDNYPRKSGVPLKNPL